MHRIYMDVGCPECDKTNYIGPIGSLLERNGLPVYSYDMAAQESIHCECGAVFLTGDFELLVEKESDPDEDEEDD